MLLRVLSPVASDLQRFSNGRGRQGSQERRRDMLVPGKGPGCLVATDTFIPKEERYPGSPAREEWIKCWWFVKFPRLASLAQGVEVVTYRCWTLADRPLQDARRPPERGADISLSPDVGKALDYLEANRKGDIRHYLETSRLQARDTA